MSNAAHARDNDPLQARGAYARLDELIALRFAAGDLCLRPRRRVVSQLSGSRHSRSRGRGLEFEELRHYQAGDELRAIDWRVTARTGEAHTRVYREERERPTLLVIDQRQSMFFGSRCCFKSVQALHSSALLAWAALADGDRVGGLVLGSDGHHEIRPRRSRRSVLQLLDAGVTANARLRGHRRDPAAGTLAERLLDLRRIARPGTTVVLASDLGDWDGQADEHASRLARHCELIVLQISDRFERDGLPSGRFRLSDGERTVSVVAGDAAAPAWQQRRDGLARRLRAIGVPLLDVDTGQSASSQLRPYFGRRPGAGR